MRKPRPPRNLDPKVAPPPDYRLPEGRETKAVKALLVLTVGALGGLIWWAM